MIDRHKCELRQALERKNAEIEALKKDYSVSVPKRPKSRKSNSPDMLLSSNQDKKSIQEEIRNVYIDSLDAKSP